MILVFKTSVKTKKQTKQLKPHINSIPSITEWSFDLEDCDKILRIDSKENIVLTLINLLKKHNFDCKELE